MTNKKSTKLTALLLALVLITACFVGGTLARYVTSTSSEDSARVAVWGINADEVEMDLFDATYTIDGVTVAMSEDGDNIIAPGTSKDNYFSIVNLDDNLKPEVMYEVAINLDDSEIAADILNNPSIQWRLDEGTYGTWEETKAQVLALSGDASGVKTYAPLEIASEFTADKVHTIGWRWIMDNNNNEMDTQMGNKAVNGDLTAKISIKVTATQVNVDTTGMLNGNGSVYDMNNPTPLVFRSAAPVDELSSVEVNGEEITQGTDYTVTEGSTVITLSENYLATLEKGNYVISIISTSMTAKASFNIIEGEIIPSTVLSENSRETISKVAKSGKASDYWSVGDKTTVKVNGVDKEVAIIDFNHDGENTITFSFIDEVTASHMNPTMTNAGSWANSEMRTETMINLLSQMENKDLLKSVEKQTIKGYADGCEDDTIYTLVTTQDKLFLPSYTELFGNNSNDFNEGYQYDYFKTQNNRIMKDNRGYNSYWWTRTPTEYRGQDFYLVTSSGDFDSGDAANTLSAIPIFVIG